MVKRRNGKGAKDDPENRFCILHQHIKDTVYGSQEWGTKDSAKINAVLKEYPQVITFSGHSHYPLDDPRSIHQKDFTSAGTFCKLYGGRGWQSARNIPSESRALSQGLLVEVDDKEVTINRRDFHTNSGQASHGKFSCHQRKKLYTCRRS